jgi:hypothetical protein
LQEEEDDHWRTMLTTLRQEGGGEITAVTWRTRATFDEDDPAGQWLSPTHFFIRLADGGPLLLDADRPGQVLNVQTDLFGLPQPAPDRGVAVATGSVPGSFYLLLLNNRFHTARIQLYHAAGDLVESLPYYHPAWPPFSPDAQWLFMYGGEERDLWTRPVDDPGGEWRLLAEGVDSYRLNADHSEMVLGHLRQAVTWQTFPKGEIIGQWSIEPYAYRRSSWSPDGRFLVVTGWSDEIDGWQSQFARALFLFGRDPERGS